MSNPSRVTGFHPMTVPDLYQPSQQLKTIADDALIRRFHVTSKGKRRAVNDPHPDLKTVLKDWNAVVTDYYVAALATFGVDDIAHAYLPGKSIRTNAERHKQSTLIQFDFKGFYDSCQYDYFKHHLEHLDPAIASDHDAVRRLLIDPLTGGVTQGLPISGALAGLTLLPFWVALKQRLPHNIRFTQYSDDLTFSYTGPEPALFTVPQLTQIVCETLVAVGLDFTLNTKKTRRQSKQYRKVTGIRINHSNQLTPSRVDYRFLRHALHILEKAPLLEPELKRWGFKSREAFVGKISYARSIDETGKIDRLIYKHRHTCAKHNLFGTWLKQYQPANGFI